MAMDLLRQLAGSSLPATFRTPAEIDKIRLLRATGLVIALTSASSDAQDVRVRAMPPRCWPSRKRAVKNWRDFASPETLRPRSRYGRPDGTPGGRRFPSCAVMEVDMRVDMRAASSDTIVYRDASIAINVEKAGATSSVMQTSSRRASSKGESLSEVPDADQEKRANGCAAWPKARLMFGRRSTRWPLERGDT